MKKVVIIITTIFCLFITACNKETIIPKNYINVEHYSSSDMSNYGNNINYYKYYYEDDMTKKLENNKFLSKMNYETLDEIIELINLYEEEIYNFDFNEENKFLEKYDLNKENINIEDYCYIDYQINPNYGKTNQENFYNFFMIYYFDISENILYYCSLQYS